MIETSSLEDIDHHSSLSRNSSNRQALHVIDQDDMFDIDESSEATSETEIGNHKSSKEIQSKRKRNRKKKSKKEITTNGNHDESRNEMEHESQDVTIEIEVVPEKIDFGDNYAEFSKVFERFKFDEAENSKEEKENELKENQNINSKETQLERLKTRMLEEEEEDEKNDENKPKISKRQLKKLTRLSVAALKQLVSRPDVVEMHDITARDPKLLVDLKATRNTVPVPRHWCAKRKYLQGKRGFEKAAFDLPDFIKRTGIQGMREAIQEKEENKSLKQKMREKVRPKMGKIDIDYQKLHDAFFRYQTKPRMTIHGDLYYEGKELETRYKEKKPGNLSDDLKIALGMPIGPGSEKVPPPWLIAMQRYGPPPSYPSLKIAGLNAPIPDGCSFGYHAGGWGKPPVDEFGRPLYGDVFGSSLSDLRKPDEEENVNKELWGQIEEEYYEEVMPPEDDSEEEEAADEEAKQDEESGEMDDTAGLKTPGEGLMTPSGISTTVSAGLETPDMIELRKRKIEAEMETSGGGETPALYKILPEKAASIGASMMGSSKVYDLSAAKKAADLSGIASGFDMTLNPDELEMDSEMLQSRYDQQLRQLSQGNETEDMSDMLADHAAKQNKKKAKQAAKQASSASAAASQDKDKNKKYKEFKF